MVRFFKTYFTFKICILLTVILSLISLNTAQAQTLHKDSEVFPKIINGSYAPEGKYPGVVSKRYLQDPTTGQMAGRVGAGRDNVPTSPKTTPPLTDVRNAVAGTMFGLGAILLGAPGAAATPPPVPRVEEDPMPTTRSMPSNKVTAACSSATKTLKKLVKKAHRTKVRFDKGQVSRAQLVKANRDVKKARSKVAAICATPVVPPKPVEDPAVVIARHSTPETAARTPQEALALVRAYRWTSELRPGTWTDFEADAQMVGVPATPEELAQTDAGFRGITVGLYSPFPDVLVSIIQDPRPAPYGSSVTLYTYATKYTNGWAVDSTKHVPVFRTAPDSDHPEGYRYEYFNEVSGQWEQANSIHRVITGWNS